MKSLLNASKCGGGGGRNLKDVIDETVEPASIDGTSTYSLSNGFFLLLVLVATVVLHFVPTLFHLFVQNIGIG